MANSPKIDLLHIDCMSYMATLPDKAFELAIVTTKYVYLQYENITRIANRKGWGVYGLCRPYFERVCSLYKRTGVAVRCAFRYWQKAIKGASKNDNGAKSYSAKIKGIACLYFQCKTQRQKQQEEIRWNGDRFVCSCLLRYKICRVYSNGFNAGHNQYKSGFFKRNILRRKGFTRLYFGLLYAWQIFKGNIKKNRAAHIHSQPNASGGVQAL